MTCFKQSVNVENYAAIKKLISFELKFNLLGSS